MLDYRRRHPAFPHQPTADQVFDEEQFETYRCLGEHITADLFSAELLGDQARQRAVDCRLTLADWYQEIADCFLRRTQAGQAANEGMSSDTAEKVAQAIERRSTAG